MRSASEKTLDQALESALRTQQGFAEWFLNQTKFAGRAATCDWSRCDRPWTNYEIEDTDPNTGVLKKIVRDGETDVLVVYETLEGLRLALHIETSAKGAGSRGISLRPMPLVRRNGSTTRTTATTKSGPLCWSRHGPP